jgi:hypothetical protein
VKGRISDRSADSGAPRGRWQQPLKRRAEVRSPEQTMGVEETDGMEAAGGRRRRGKQKNQKGTAHRLDLMELEDEGWGGAIERAA